MDPGQCEGEIVASRQAIEAALRAADARLARLAPLMQTYADDMLLDDGGKWTVADCLAHVAASARVSRAGQRGLRRLSEPPQPPDPNFSIDDYTARQVADRAGKSVADLVAETVQGHALALEDLRAMDDATLDTKIPDLQAGRPAQSVGGLILRSLEYHEGGQMDRIESAIRVRTRWA